MRETGILATVSFPCAERVTNAASASIFYMETPVPGRLAALRATMRRHCVDALFIPAADPHLSEYLPEIVRRYEAGQDTGTIAAWVSPLLRAKAEREAAAQGRALTRYDIVGTDAPMIRYALFRAGKWKRGV